MPRIISGVTDLMVGGTALAVVKLTDIKDITAVAVGVVTIVCLITKTFVLERRKKK